MRLGAISCLHWRWQNEGRKNLCLCRHCCCCASCVLDFAANSPRHCFTTCKPRRLATPADAAAGEVILAALTVPVELNGRASRRRCRIVASTSCLCKLKLLDLAAQQGILRFKLLAERPFTRQVLLLADSAHGWLKTLYTLSMGAFPSPPHPASGRRLPQCPSTVRIWNRRSAGAAHNSTEQDHGAKRLRHNNDIARRNDADVLTTAKRF